MKQTPYEEEHEKQQIGRESVLEEASRIAKDRGEKYGDPTPNMRATARSWDAYIKNRLEAMGIDVPDETIVRAADAPQMMIDLKKARFQTGSVDRDHFVDEAGYARVTAEVEGLED